MIAVVTGGGGFIGRNLIARLLDKGHTVRRLVRAPVTAGDSDVPSWDVRGFDVAALTSCDAFEGADAVFHLGGATNAVSAAEYESANVAPTTNLLRALVARGSAPRFVFMSSQAAAGPSASRSSPLDESAAPKPIEAYGRSKLAAEQSIAAFGDRVPFSIIRPCSVYGPWDRAFLHLFRWAALGTVFYPAVERQWINLLHVDDVVSGTIACATADAALGRTYFLASDASLQWRELGEEIARAMGRSAAHVNIPLSMVRLASAVRDAWGAATGTAGVANLSKATLAGQPAWVASNARARAEIGFRPERSLPDGVRDTYLWYTRQGWLGLRRADGAVS